MTGTNPAAPLGVAGLPRNEAALQARVLGWLNARGSAHFENRSPGPFGSKGVPDITGTYRGRSVAIELKHPREHGPRADDKRWAAQKRYLAGVCAAGGYALGTNNFTAVAALIRHIDAEVSHPTSGYYEESWA
jgi:hypothetical protein